MISATSSMDEARSESEVEKGMKVSVLDFLEINLKKSVVMVSRLLIINRGARVLNLRRDAESDRSNDATFLLMKLTLLLLFIRIESEGKCFVDDVS